jgi:hypothetical protein
MKKERITLERLKEVVSYDAISGEFIRIDSGRGIRTGVSAGSFTQKGYRVIVIDKVVYLAQRLAWLFVYGEMPDGKITFKDEDPGNCRIENLALNRGIKGYDSRTPEGRSAYQKVYRKENRDACRDKDLKKSFGISLADYARMVADQGNKCAICDCHETQMRNGFLKALAVDHNHQTGAIRGLLCAACNQAIGKFGEDRDIMLSAIRYLDKHSGRERAQPALIMVSGGKSEENQ